METENTFQSLLIVMSLAAIMPLILNRFKKVNIPIVVGEIVAGLIVGRSWLNWVSTNDVVINFLAEFGLVFLMFLAGMEIDISVLSTNGNEDQKKRIKNSPVFLSGAHFLLTLFFAAGISYYLFQHGYIKNTWMMALILSTTSLGVVVPVLKEKNIIRSLYGQTVLISALFADFATMFLITILVAVLSNGMSFEILLIGLLFVAFFLLYRFGILLFHRIKPLRIAIEELSYATTQIKVRIAIAIMLILVALSEMIGSEIILGAFLAGMIIRLISTPADAHVVDQLETVGYGFLIPIFFITVGAGINIPLMLQSSTIGILVPILLGSAIIVKLVPALLFKLAFSWKESIGAGFLLSSRLSLIIAAVAIGVRLNVISENVQAVLILIAILTVTIFPPLFNIFVPVVDNLEKQRRYVVIGTGRFGLDIARKLVGHREQVEVLAIDSDNTNYLESQGLEVHLLNRDFLSTQDFKNSLSMASSVICTLPDVENNYKICSVIKHFDNEVNVLALVENPNDAPRFKALEVDTFSISFDTPAIIAAMVRNPATYALLADAHSDKELVEVKISSRSIVRKKVRDLQLPGDVLILSIRRKGEMILPHGGTQLQRNDSVTLAGSRDCLLEASNLFI